MVNLKLSKPDNYSNEVKSAELIKQHNDLTVQLKQNYSSWESLSLKVDELENSNNSQV